MLHSLSLRGVVATPREQKAEGEGREGGEGASGAEAEGPGKGEGRRHQGQGEGLQGQAAQGTTCIRQRSVTGQPSMYV